MLVERQKDAGRSPAEFVFAGKELSTLIKERIQQNKGKKRVTSLLAEEAKLFVSAAPTTTTSEPSKAISQPAEEVNAAPATTTSEPSKTISEPKSKNGKSKNEHFDTHANNETVTNRNTSTTTTTTKGSSAGPSLVSACWTPTQWDTNLRVLQSLYHTLSDSKIFKSVTSEEWKQLCTICCAKSGRTYESLLDGLSSWTTALAMKQLQDKQPSCNSLQKSCQSALFVTSTQHLPGPALQYLPVPAPSLHGVNVVLAQPMP
eukprot:TRINITY_DN76727_c0_g1_i1.p1 TRINITY_DN76727_c0_g1~~TRINITY_DN76727_c0_g1_i1.p1  ORF type:complete len:305 (-),score=30.42 TRINITY_DN76727_c0_g1_i1:154-933(-)